MQKKQLFFQRPSGNVRIVPYASSFDNTTYLFETLKRVGIFAGEAPVAVQVF
jgi:hypothetical protein